MAIPKKAVIYEIESEISHDSKRHIKISSQTEPTALVPLFQKMKIELPQLKIWHEKNNYDFYWVRVTCNIMLPTDQFPWSL